MPKRTYRYEIVGRVTVDDVDLQSAALGARMVTQAPPDSGDAFGERLEFADQSPDDLVKAMVTQVFYGLVPMIPAGEHVMPAVTVEVEAVAE